MELSVSIMKVLRQLQYYISAFIGDSGDIWYMTLLPL